MLGASCQPGNLQRDDGVPGLSLCEHCFLLALYLAVPVFVFQKDGVRSGGFQFPHLSIDILFGFVSGTAGVSSYCEKNYSNPDDAKKMLGDKTAKTGCGCVIVSAVGFLIFMNIFWVVTLFIGGAVTFAGVFLQQKGEEKDRQAEQERKRKEAAEDRARQERLKNDPIHAMIMVKQFESQLGINSSANSMPDVNTQQLRSDLMDYYGTAMYSGSPMAQADLIHVQRASDAELISEAQKSGFDLNKYTQ